jgi:hypothetical protein
LVEERACARQVARTSVRWLRVARAQDGGAEPFSFNYSILSVADERVLAGGQLSSSATGGAAKSNTTL